MSTSTATKGAQSTFSKAIVIGRGFKNCEFGNINLMFRSLKEQEYGSVRKHFNLPRSHREQYLNGDRMLTMGNPDIASMVHKDAFRVSNTLKGVGVDHICLMVDTAQDKGYAQLVFDELVEKGYIDCVVEQDAADRGGNRLPRKLFIGKIR